MKRRSELRLPAKGRSTPLQTDKERPHQAELTKNLKPLQPGQAPKHTRTWSRDETTKQMLLVDQLLSEGLSDRRVWAEMKRAGHPIGFTRVKNLIKRVQENWLREHSDNRRYFRSKQIRNLEGTIALARNGVRKQKRDKNGKPMVYPDGTPVLQWEMRPNLPAAVRAIEVLSRITGTQAPQEININVAVSDALVGAIANLSSEQVQGMIAEYKSNVALAEAAKNAGLLPPGNSDKAAE